MFWVLHRIRPFFQLKEIKGHAFLKKSNWSWVIGTSHAKRYRFVNDKGFSFSCENDLIKFYRASNSILTAVNKPSEEILLQLLYSNCIPTLTYACTVKEYPSKQMQNCNTAVNDALRLIFGYNRWESIRHLRDSFGYKSLTDIFGRSRKKFYELLP